jgi:hypothetical protein
VSIPADVRVQAESALREFCDAHSSEPGADRLRYAYKFETNAATLLAERPGFINPDEWIPTPVARFRYSEARDEWSLYWPDSSGKWHRVSGLKPSKDLRELLRAVVSDSLGVFWS